jgi:hypothetical protein
MMAGHLKRCSAFFCVLSGNIMLRCHRLLLYCINMLAAVPFIWSPASGQSYPRWFLFPGSVPCASHAVGYSQTSFYRDSSIVRAFRFACEVYAIHQRSTITGSDAFWATEGGTVKMSSEYNEEFDTIQYQNALTHFAVVRRYVDSRITIVLAADSACANGEIPSDTVDVRNIAKPGWVSTLPAEKGYAYAVGMAERYFYETSSWNVAEQHARLNLARQRHTKLESLQKSTIATGEALQRESVAATLDDIRIIARWPDPVSGILYVLSRMKL